MSASVSWSAPIEGSRPRFQLQTIEPNLAAIPSDRGRKIETENVPRSPHETRRDSNGADLHRGPLSHCGSRGCSFGSEP